jgi:hypothetical protein
MPRSRRPVRLAITAVPKIPLTPEIPENPAKNLPLISREILLIFLKLFLISFPIFLFLFLYLFLIFFSFLPFLLFLFFFSFLPFFFPSFFLLRLGRACRDPPPPRACAPGHGLVPGQRRPPFPPSGQHPADQAHRGSTQGRSRAACSTPPSRNALPH